MLIYRTAAGWELETGSGRVRLPQQSLTTREDLYDYLAQVTGTPSSGAGPLLAPIEQQEVWAAGVTYYRSRTARMAESEASGGKSFYDRVYQAQTSCCSMGASKGPAPPEGVPVTWARYS